MMMALFAYCWCGCGLIIQILFHYWDKNGFDFAAPKSAPDRIKITSLLLVVIFWLVMYVIGDFLFW